MTSVGDEMLRWVSEVGAGRWQQLRDVSAYLNRRDDRDAQVSDMPTKLEQLGHLNIDWEKNEWSVATPALNISPGMGLCAFLSGSRPKYVMDRLNEALDDLAVFPFEVDQGNAPTALFVKCPNVDYADQIAEHLELQLNFDPSSALLDCVREVGVEQPVLGDSPRTDIDTLAVWNVDTLNWNATTSTTTKGLYRFEVHGRFTFRQFDGNEWFIVDLPTGQFVELERQCRNVLTWSLQDGGSLHLQRGVALPTNVHRALVAASGMLPARTGSEWIYCNVSSSTAFAIGDKLHQSVLQTKE